MNGLRSFAGSAALLLAACQPDGGHDATATATATTATGTATPTATPQAGNAVIPNPDSTEAYAGVGAGETLHFTGTEPFWGGTATGTSLTYTTPEDPDGTAITVERFAGRGGLSLSGRLGAGDFVMTVTPGQCSDGMSDRSYPFTVTLKLGDDLRKGCGWTERQPFDGPQQP